VGACSTLNDGRKTLVNGLKIAQFVLIMAVWPSKRVLSIGAGSNHLLLLVVTKMVKMVRDACRIRRETDWWHGRKYMAGDVNVGEALLTFVPEGAAPPPILHEYGPSLRIRLVEGSDDETGRIAAAPINLEALNATEKLGYDAFVFRNTSEYAAMKMGQPHDGERWDRDARSAPADDASIGASVVGAAPTMQSHAPSPGTSVRLTGRVAVGSIIVSGPNPMLQINQSEQRHIVAAIQNSLTWLASKSPMKDVTWVHDIRLVTVNAPDHKNGFNLEAFESPWRDEALRSLGLSPGLSGVQQHVNDLIATRRTNWGFCGLFTKYTLGHFAYATIGGPRLVVHYNCDGWGSAFLDRVFAHEVAHVFGAPDEYHASGCDCTTTFGYYNRPNSNCARCAPNGGVDCIMRANTWDMCPHTPFHLGFNTPLVAATP
jgi:hypothetical protein